ncbi:MAG: segregation and condensation protein A [Patescibacteria group bacterium UBA2163]
MDNTFNVTVGTFTGPLDVLLTLIEERKMLISDVSLADVADEFVHFVQEQEYFPAGEAAHFILVAATLLLIKSRSLLPMMKLTEEEEEDVEGLEKRLNLYKIFRDAGKELHKQHTRLFFGGRRRETTPLFAPAPDMDPEALYNALHETLKRVPRKEQREQVAVKTVVSLGDMMSRLNDRIERALSLSFTDFMGSPEDKREIVVGFLAMLELVKRGTVLVEQEKQFSDITMNYHGNTGPPRYN